MDKLINAGKEFLQEQSSGRDEREEPTGQSLPGGNKAQGGAYPAGGGFLSNLNLDSAASLASDHAGSSGSTSMFSSIISSISSKEDKLAASDVDEEDAVRKHKKTYNDEDSQADEKSLGTAAAIQALKLWNKGETGDKQDKGSFLGLAMAEASKLFDDKAAKGKVSEGTDKQSVVQQAGEMAVKLWLKSQGQQQGGIAGFASKFM